MPWIAGIDEAGYGPNLGPFVMAAVSCKVPYSPGESNLWSILKDVVRRKKDPKDGRLHIEDSKVVYSPSRQLKELERSVCAAIISSLPDKPPTLSSAVQSLANGSFESLREECWFTGVTELPVQADREELRHCADRFHISSGHASISWGKARCEVVCPKRFNGLVDRCGSKSAVLILSLSNLLRDFCYDQEDEIPINVYVDKHGGRNNYSTILQQAVTNGTVVAVKESTGLSQYEIHGLARPVQVTFEPKADGKHFCAALASMLAKYLRELCMHEFNNFWQQHVSDLKRTAGYPVDAARFMEDIRPAVDKLGIDMAAIWRCK